MHVQTAVYTGFPNAVDNCSEWLKHPVKGPAELQQRRFVVISINRLPRCNNTGKL
jgi:hypothetical protein